jgi:hypothetical protein
LLPRAGFAACRQTFVRRGQNCGVGLRSSGADRWASRYGIKAGGTARTLAAGTLPCDGGVAFETPRQHAGAPLAATSWGHSRSLAALPLSSRFATFSQPVVRSPPAVRMSNGNSSEVRGLGFNRNGGRGPHPLGRRASQERWRAARASSQSFGTDAAGDRRTGRTIERPKPNYIFGRGGKCSER